MTLLEQTYRQLHDAGLVRNTANFSRQYLCRNANWYAWQKHVGRDMGAAAAIQCLRTVREQLRDTHLAGTQQAALEATAAALLAHLNQAHLVADVCT